MNATTHRSWAAWLDAQSWNTSADEQMPMLPAIAADVMGIALNADVGVVKLAHVIAKDQVLATRVLRLANSAYCAPMSQVTTINDAIVRMGTAAVRSVVLAVCFSSADAYSTRGRQYVDHGIGTAYLARLAAEPAGLDPDEAFMYGLLHDVGKLLLDKMLREYQKQGGKPVEEEVEEVVRVRHAEIGSRLLRQWNMPPLLEQPVRFHHAPDECDKYPSQAMVCYIADRLSHRYGFGCEAEPDDALFEDPYLAAIGASESWVRTVDQRAPGLFEVARHIGA